MCGYFRTQNDKTQIRNHVINNNNNNNNIYIYIYICVCVYITILKFKFLRGHS